MADERGITLKKEKKHEIAGVLSGSPAELVGIGKGDFLITINGETIEDVFDYQFAQNEKHLHVVIERKDGTNTEFDVEKDEDEDFGLEFVNGFMDDYRSCHNKCIFCFIDQMPKGMRETLYFKDDDSRLSFLQGNYVTLTNMSEKDVERIIRYRMEPINISFQTMNRELRCKMLNNRFAGDALDKVDRFFEAGITMNGQIVLCKGVNDGEELEYSIREMEKYEPHLQSVSIVPVGLSKYREGLYPLEPFTKEDAIKVIATVEAAQKRSMEKYGTHFIHCSDEWYILAEQEMPPEENYDGYLQLENGVGMIRSMTEEFNQVFAEMEAYQKRPFHQLFGKKAIEKTLGFVPQLKRKREISMATGKLAYSFIQGLAERMMQMYPNLTIHVYEIINEFFGEHITVSGLLTGQDLIKQLTGRQLGETLMLPENILRSGETVFLDDYTVADLEKTLQVPLTIVKSNGYDFIATVLGCTSSKISDTIAE